PRPVTSHLRPQPRLRRASPRPAAAPGQGAPPPGRRAPRRCSPYHARRSPDSGGSREPTDDRRRRGLGSFPQPTSVSLGGAAAPLTVDFGLTPEGPPPRVLACPRSARGGAVPLHCPRPSTR